MKKLTLTLLILMLPAIASAQFFTHRAGIANDVDTSGTMINAALTDREVKADSAGDGSNVAILDGPPVLQEGDNMTLTVIEGGAGESDTVKFASSAGAGAGLIVEEDGAETATADTIDFTTGVDVTTANSKSTVSVTLGTDIESSEIANETIIEEDLKATAGVVDEDILTWETTGAEFEWHTPAELYIIGWADSGTYNELSQGKLIVNTGITIGNAADSGVTDSAVTTLQSVQAEIGDSLGEYSLTSAIASTYETITNVAKIGDDTTTFKNAADTVGAWDNRGYPDASVTEQGIASFADADFAVTTGEVTLDPLDSTNFADNTVSLDDIQWTYEWIELATVHGWNRVLEDTIYLCFPVHDGSSTWLLADSSANITAGDRDTFFVSGVIPFDCTIDSLEYRFKNTGDSGIVDIDFYGPDISTFTNATDSLYFTSTTNRTSATWALAAETMTNDITATAGYKYAVRFISDFRADNNTLNLNDIRMRVKR